MGRSLPSRGAWIETICGRDLWDWDWSLPSRGAWIETLGGLVFAEDPFRVAPLTGGVD